LNGSIRRFIASESAAGVVLAVAAIVALVISNSPLAPGYERFLQMRVELRIADDWLVLSKPWLLWVNDLWMTVFFFLVGLEVKREVLAGELASLKQALLPAVAALGGMLVPALIYRAEPRRRGGPARLGHPDGDRHSVRPWHPAAARLARAAIAEGLPDRGGDHR